jgi:hypothetical protein
MAEEQQAGLAYRAWRAVTQNRLLILFLVIVALQALTWRSVEAMRDAVETLNLYSCGVLSPCKVTITNR